MSSLKAFQILQSASRQYRQGRESLSKGEITRKINEIKYLSAQKKVPRITLRKEIIHLENKLQGIFDVEQLVLKEKKRESGKVLALKRQIQMLQQRLMTAEDQDLQKKIDTFTQLLAEYLAQKKTQREVSYARLNYARLKPQLKRRRGKMLAKVLVTEQDVVSEMMKSRVRNLQERVALLQQALEVSKGLGKDKQVQTFQDKITVLERKIKEYADQHPALLEEDLPEENIMEVEEYEEEKPDIKHTILFGEPLPTAAVLAAEEAELEKELPLPPPPKRGGKK